MPALNNSQIVIQMSHNIADNVEVWSLRQFTDSYDDSAPHPNTILDINLSGDASQLAIGT